MAVTSTKRPIGDKAFPIGPDGRSLPGEYDPVDSTPIDPVDPNGGDEDEDDDDDSSSRREADEFGKVCDGVVDDTEEEFDVTDPVEDVPGEMDGVDGDDSPSLESQGLPPVKRPRGRPKGTTKRKIEEAAHRSPDFLPRPSNFRYVNKPVLFFRYWEKVFKEFPDRVVCYVYRQWPVIDRERSRKTKNIDKPQQPIQANNHRQEILHRYGSGDYKFILTDTMLHKEICNAFVTGLREMADFPPMVDMDDIVLEDPANRPFIDRMKQRGIKMPGDPGYGQEERQEGEDMANTIAMETLSGTVSDLTDRIIGMQERQIEKQERQRSETPPPQSVDSMAATKGMEIVSQAANMANTILQQATTKVSEAMARQNDPMANITALIDVAKVIAGPREDSGKMMASIMEIQAKAAEKQEGLYMMMLHQSDKRLETLEKLLVPGAMTGQQVGLGLAPAGMGQQAPMQQQATGLLGELDNITRIKKKLEDIGLLPNPEDNKRGGDGWTSYIPMILAGLQFVAGSYASIVHNQAVAKLGEGHAVPPPPPPQPQVQPGDEMPDGQPYNGQPYPPPYPQQPAPQGQPQGQPQPSQGPDMQLTTMIDFLRKIEQPLLMHLKQGMTGGDFANWLILSEEKGQLIYDSLVESGKGQILSLLRLHQPIWSVVAGIPQRFDAFLDEFLAGAIDDDGPDDGPVSVDLDSSGRHNAPEDAIHLGMAPLDPEVLPPVAAPTAAKPAPMPGSVAGVVIDVKPVKAGKGRK